MKLPSTLAWILVLAVARGALGQSEPQQYVNRQLPMQHMAGLLQLMETIPLPTQGYMDHLACDLRRGHLFIAGENNNEVVVVDLTAGKVLHVTPLAGHPRKPFYDPALDQLWVDIGDNTVVALSGASFAPVRRVELTGGANAIDRDPDNAAYDAAQQRYYVAVRNRVAGSEAGSIEIIDTRSARLVAHLPLHVDEPAALALDAAAARLYVGIGDVVGGQSVVKVIDTRDRTVVAEWPIPGGPQPHVAAIDPAHHRLFLGSRLGGGHTAEPGKLIVLSADTGRLVQALDAPGGGDEIFYDSASARLYFSGSTGTLAVYHEDDPDHVRFLGSVPTGALAKSGLWVPQLQRYYAAVPAHLVQVLPLSQYGMGDWVTEQAHLMVFQAQR
jgi:DNA-binding beta-propeller fold protein YncE